MQQITITKRADGTYRKIVPAQLAYKGEGPQGNCYEPEHIGKLSASEVDKIYGLKNAIRKNRQAISIDPSGHMSSYIWNMDGRSIEEVKRSDARKEELWKQITENRKALSSIVLSVRHTSEDKIVRPLPYHVKTFTRACNSINKLINSIFEHTSTPYSQIQQMQLCQ